MNTQDAVNLNGATVDRDHALHLLRSMIRIRRLEEKCAELYSATKIRGFLHLYDGEEAVAVGILEALTRDDAVVATYREHGHALIRGVSAGAILAEMYGKQEGCSRGRGGSMHLFDNKTRFYGGNAIVGGGLPIAVGLALADKMQHKQRVTCCFFGEGAVAEGEFHESLNLAALWQLPVLFVCENNLYAMGTALKFEQAVQDITRKAASYDVSSAAVDGMDVLAVETAAKKAAQTVRTQGKPFFLECRTYRFRAHSMYDPELYRPKSEVEEWKKSCPIATFARKMKTEGCIGNVDIETIERDVAREINEAVAFAEACTWEPIEDMTRFVHSERRTP
ncbi:MAG: pyruvate dehydrogenase (acetyl-transferring) E1 component subunit alpha [Desulfobacterales bacterium]|jgi:pyruvate dehydrogenase E1 component alpha subunit|nr:pyruvate dehydrogenase (acetyl-transferring) E1 component subunit alpha [Desulfobacterales bacterium]